MNDIQAQNRVGINNKIQSAELAKEAEVKETDENIEFSKEFVQSTSLQKEEALAYDEAQDAVSLLNNAAKTQEASLGLFNWLDSLMAEKELEETKDGLITQTMQGFIGDCWLLSGVNALSYCEEGQKAIKDTFNYKDNGDVEVNFKGFDEAITISQKEINEAKRTLYYSFGDDDMVILELASEKVFDKISQGDYLVDPNPISSLATALTKTSETVKDGLQISSGSPSIMLYLLTGKEPKIDVNKKEEIEDLLDKFEKDKGKNYALAANISGKAELKDIEGNEVELPATYHAFALKGVEGDVITLIDPWDSREEIKVKKEDFLNCNPRISSVDMSKEDKKANILSNKFEFDADGNKVCSFMRENECVTKSDGTKAFADSEKITYDKNGNIFKREMLDKDGNLLFYKEFNTATNELVKCFVS